MLLENGADVNSKDIHGKTALVKACKLGVIDIVKLLIKYGASVNSSSSMWKDIVCSAICKG